MGSVTKRLIQQWNLVWKEHTAEEKRNRIRMLLEAGNLIFFFTHKGELYGAGEGSRVTYAKMVDKNDEDYTKGWLKEANFPATNLYKCIDGEQNQTIFGEKDLDGIKVVSDKDKVEKMLHKHIEK